MQLGDDRKVEKAAGIGRAEMGRLTLCQMGSEAVISAAQRKQQQKALKRQLIKRSSLLKIASAWIITVPVSALMAVIFCFTLRGMMLP